MKKGLVLVLSLLLLGGIAFGEITWKAMGTANFAWGVTGQLLDNSGNFASTSATTDIPAWALSAASFNSGALYSTANSSTAATSSGLFLYNDSITSTTAALNATPYVTVTVKDESGYDMVTARGLFAVVTLGSATAAVPTLKYITFPNVVKDLLGISLVGPGLIAPANAPSGNAWATSTSTALPSVKIIVSPIDSNLTANLSLTAVQVPLKNQFGYYTNSGLNFVLGADVTYTLVLAKKWGANLDYATISFGTVYDSANFQVTGVASGATGVTETQVPYAATGAAAVVKTGDLRGFATIPLGVNLTGKLLGGLLSFTLDSDIALAQGHDLADLDTLGAAKAWEMPLYAAVTLAYNMTADDAAADKIRKLGQAKSAAQNAFEKATAATLTTKYNAARAATQVSKDAVDAAKRGVTVAEENLAAADKAAKDAEAAVKGAANADSAAVATAAAAAANTAFTAATTALATAKTTLATAEAVVGAKVAVADAMTKAAEAARANYLKAIDAYNAALVLTIVPAVTFKYSSDFWKWTMLGTVQNKQGAVTVGATAATASYKGFVSAADFIGRPMSLTLSIPVTNLVVAGMPMTTTITAKAGFGDGAYNHGFGALATGLGSAKTNETLAILLSDKKTAVGANSTTANDFWFATDALVYSASLDLSIVPVVSVSSILTLGNTFTYTHDGLGIVGTLVGARYGTYLDQILNVTKATLVWKPVDTVAVTFWGDVIFTMNTYASEMGNKPDTTNSVAQQASKTTVGYDAGAFVTLSF